MTTHIRVARDDAERLASIEVVVEAFDVPPLLRHHAMAVTDPAPGGDGDGVAEPGETIRIVETVGNVNPFTVTSATSPGITVTAGMSSFG